MDCRTVFIFLCLLISQATCIPVRNGAKPGALNKTIRQMRQEIRSTLDHLAKPGLLPNNSCVYQNITELGPEEQPLTGHQLSSFRCYMQNMSNVCPYMSSYLQKASQYTHDMEQLMSSHAASRNCSLPLFEEETESYEFVKCLLQLLDKRLSKTKF